MFDTMFDFCYYYSYFFGDFWCREPSLPHPANFCGDGTLPAPPEVPAHFDLAGGLDGRNRLHTPLGRLDGPAPSSAAAGRLPTGVPAAGWTQAGQPHLVAAELPGDVGAGAVGRPLPPARLRVSAPRGRGGPVPPASDAPARAPAPPASLPAEAADPLPDLRGGAGRLLNAGVGEVLRDADWGCLLIHDVDLLAEDDRNTYACDRCNPTHLAVAIDKFHYRLPYSTYFGGVVAVTPEQFRKMNGFSNQYWGWGREDDDLCKRVALSGMKVVRPPVALARYKMIKHERDGGNEENLYNLELLNRTEASWHWDGLNSLTYQLLSKERRHLFTHLMINVGEKPSPVAALSPS
ncbi:beta-1,4-galactosyltransferase 3-like isoform X2 [Festucalex cinctus]